MKRRCGHRRKENAEHYVGKGITYDPRWKEFEAFLADMGERPAGMTLDRRDNDKGYSKANCRWATPTQQTRNRSIAKLVTYQGRTMALGDWTDELGLNYALVCQRLGADWSVEDAFMRPNARVAA